MGATTIEYHLLAGTRAAVGRSGAHVAIADRPPGVAGGIGLGFNGGELLALAIGGCFCNDLQAIADDMGLSIGSLRVVVTIDFGGVPSRATGSRMEVECTLADGSDASALIAQAKAVTTIGNSIRAGIPLEIAAA
jgi:organic hydroperoxide reductase OsmC/OhrA